MISQGLCPSFDHISSISYARLGRTTSFLTSLFSATWFHFVIYLSSQTIDTVRQAVMVMSIISHTISAWFVFLLPSYATFKALSYRPSSEAALQRWSMYWVVIGAFVAVEYLAEWAISWVPFYWELKTVFLLYLALPQTEGSTYVYTAYIQPFFVKHEEDLDSGYVSAYRKFSTFLQARFESVWELVCHSIKTAAIEQSVGPGQQPTHSSLSLDSAIALWKTYCPFLTGSSRSDQSSNSSTSLVADYRNVRVSENGQL